MPAVFCVPGENGLPAKEIVTTKSRNSRGAAASVLSAWLQTGEFPSRLMDGVGEDRAFVMELVYGVIRWHRPLLRIRSKFARRKPAQSLDAFLLVGLYQLLFLDNVQEYAAVNETVEAAKRQLGAGAGKFVNAILRRVQAAGRDEIMKGLVEAPAAIRLSHPDLLFTRWRERWGEEKTVALCEWNNGRPDVVVRVNPAKISLEDCAAAFAKAGLEAAPHAFDPKRFLVLPRGAHVAQVPGFKEGWFYVQDPSTSVAVDLLAPRPGERVLDACAAPGGKMSMMAERMAGEGTMVAMDVADERLAHLRDNLQRLGWSRVHVVQGHAAKPAAVCDTLSRRGTEPCFDAILLDVPCTNTGVLRRRPDARWRFSARRLEKACQMQRAILSGAASLLAPGGRMVYSTCSVEDEENEAQIRAWLSAHAGFECIQTRFLFPPDSGTDGAFAALLQKR